MPKMVMPRNFTVATLYGFTVVFKKGVAAQVPDHFKVIEECMKYGAEYVEEDERDAFLDPGEIQDRAPKTPQERKARILALMLDMKANDVEHREHFTAANRPAVRYVSGYLGFEVTKEEVSNLWLQASKGEAEE